MAHAYCLGRAYRKPDLSAAGYVREQLDRLKIGQRVTAVTWSGKKKPIPLSPSTLAETQT